MALTIMYSQASLRPGVLFFILTSGTQLLSLYPSAHQDDVRTTHFSMAMSTSTSTSAISALRGCHLHVVLTSFCSNHSIHVITTLQLRGDISSSDSIFGLFSSLTVCGAPTVTAGDVRVYLVDYTFCIIGCHICRDIFDRINIMYCRLSYISGGVLPLKTLLYIYRPRDIMQYIPK
jgi:hypothetical protein